MKIKKMMKLVVVSPKDFQSKLSVGGHLAGQLVYK